MGGKIVKEVNVCPICFKKENIKRIKISNRVWVYIHEDCNVIWSANVVQKKIYNVRKAQNPISLERLGKYIVKLCKRVGNGTLLVKRREWVKNT